MLDLKWTVLSKILDFVKAHHLRWRLADCLLINWKKRGFVIEGEAICARFVIYGAQSILVSENMPDREDKRN